MKYRVRDQLHVSSLGPETMGKGHEFEVTKVVGDPLVKAGLVDLVEGETEEPAPNDPVAEKAEPDPQNKAEPAAPANKATTKRKAKAKA